MRDVVFTFPGTRTVYVWLYKADGIGPHNTGPYNIDEKTWEEPGTKPLSVRADSEGRFRFPVESVLWGVREGGEYELRVHETTCRQEPPTCLRVFFRVTWKPAAVPVVTVLGRQYGNASQAIPVQSSSGTIEAAKSFLAQMNDWWNDVFRMPPNLEAKMTGPGVLEFNVDGAEAVRLWLYIKDTNSQYNWMNRTFDGRNGQSARLPVGADGRVLVDVGAIKLPDGEYEFRLAPEGKGEPPKPRKIYFHVSGDHDGTQTVTKTGEHVPSAGPETATGGINKALLKDALASMPYFPPAPPKPKPRHAAPMVTIGGRTQTIAEWAAEKGLNPLDVYARLAQGITLEEALAAPGRNPQRDAPDRAGRAIELE